jgi:hypothetical protein
MEAENLIMRDPLAAESMAEEARDRSKHGHGSDAENGGSGKKQGGPQDYEWTEEDQEKQRHFFSQVTAASSLAGGLVVAALVYEFFIKKNKDRRASD